MTNQVFRYEVPVDDQWHAINNLKHIVHVDCRDTDVVEFWATNQLNEPESGVTYMPDTRKWEYRVFGTGHPTEGNYVGTALTPSRYLVWHLFKRRIENFNG